MKKRYIIIAIILTAIFLAGAYALIYYTTQWLCSLIFWLITGITFYGG